MTILKRAGKYFASILVETNDYNPNDNDRNQSVGIDFGIKELAVLSTGKVFAANQKLKENLKKLAKFQRNFAKKIKGSVRRAKPSSKLPSSIFALQNNILQPDFKCASEQSQTVDLFTASALAV